MRDRRPRGGVRYRPLRKGDFGAVHDVALASWREAYGAWLSPEFMEERVGATYSPEALEIALDAVRREKAAFWVALHDSHLVGFAYVDDRGEGLELVRLYIQPAHFGQGIGSELLKRSEEFVLSRALTDYFCYVHPKNERAMRFYAARGFHHVPDRDKNQPPLWHMRKRLA